MAIAMSNEQYVRYIAECNTFYAIEGIDHHVQQLDDPRNAIANWQACLAALPARLCGKQCNACPVMDTCTLLQSINALTQC